MIFSVLGFQVLNISQQSSRLFFDATHILKRNYPEKSELGPVTPVMTDN
jgi:hypothetical protein